MRALERNKRKIYYALYVGKEAILDEYGNPTGEFQVNYSQPQEMRINVSAAKGEQSLRQFGESEDYDKVLVTDDVGTPIDESTILWVDRLDTGNPHDYIVRKIAKSLNSVSIAISKVNVGV